MDWSEAAVRVLYVLLILLVGFVFGFMWNAYSSADFTGLVIDADSAVVPSDFLDNKDILIYDDKVVLNLENAKLSSYDSTGSMLPSLGRGVNGIVVDPKSESEVEVGDIVSFKKGNKIIVHRVVEKGLDKEGTYFITKGDNSELPDGKIRFEDIEHVVVALVY